MNRKKFVSLRTVKQQWQEMGKTRRKVLMALLFFGMAQGLATDYRKLSGYVRQVISERKYSADSPNRSRSEQQQKHTDRRLTAFVKIDVSETDDVLREYDCRLYAQKGDITIASIPLSRLSMLSEHPAVKRIEASPMASLTMDTTTTVVNILPVYTATDEHPAFTGDGVVVGLMDVGFDLTHPNFYDASMAHYRIGAFWDQLSKDTVGSPFPVGRDYVGYEAVREHEHSYDGLIQTHGTHTLGIAAGSGYDSPYRGVAYGSDICLVSNAVSNDIELIDSVDYDKYTTAVDALGFKYIFDYADRQGKPCVVSFSEGYPPYLDEDDSLFAEFLDGLIGPGHIVVVSAGNENVSRTYMSKPKGTEEAGSFLNVFKTSASYRIKSDGQMRIHLYVYNKESGTVEEELTISSDDSRLDSLLVDTLALGSYNCQINVIRYASALDTDNMYLLKMDADTTLTVRPIALVIEGKESKVEVFGTSYYAFKRNTIDSRWKAGEYGRNILAPGCFPAAICVGSTAHRLGFTNYEGQYIDRSSDEEVGMRSYFSSTGPTVSGLTKPNVMAPGNNVISSYSSFYLENNPEAKDIAWDVAHFDYNGRTYAWNADSGTSMATPVVAGIIALWLQANPRLTPQDVMDLLSRTCRHPDENLTYPNNEYGYGEIDAYRGLLDILGLDKIEGISLHQPSLLHISRQDGQLRLLFDQQPSSELRLRVYSVSGTLCYEGIIQPLTSELFVTLPFTLKGLYVVQIDSRSKEFSGSQIVRM